MEKKKMIIRIATGRLGKCSYNLYDSMGYGCTEYGDVLEMRKQGVDIRKYIFEGEKSIFIEGKPTDLPYYVANGFADITVCGDDTKFEYELAVKNQSGNMFGRDYKSHNLLKKLNEDCGFQNCRFCVIGREQDKEKYAYAISSCPQNLIFNEPIVVATEYPNLAKHYLQTKYPQTLFDYLQLNGKTETAIEYGGANIIFDLVGTGRTLQENNLVIYEEALNNPTKVIANNSSLRNNEDVEELYGRLTK